MTLLIILGIPALIIIWYITANNKLVALKNNRENAFADIDVQLKQRHDLIPQLVGAVKGYMDHESVVLTRITEARSNAMSAKTINEKVSTENELGAAMGAFNVQVEAYPNLKASTNFSQLQEEISDIENKLAAVRRFFNSSTKELNTAIESIPINIVASIKKMTSEPMFELDISERDSMEKTPEIKF